MTTSASPEKRPLSWLVAAVLSLLVPGAGQLYARQGYRGAIIFITFLLTALATIWYAVPAWYAAPVALWLWNILDAVSLARGRARSAIVPAIIVLVMGYGIGWQVTGIDLPALARNFDRARHHTGSDAAAGLSFPD